MFTSRKGLVVGLAVGLAAGLAFAASSAGIAVADVAAPTTPATTIPAPDPAPIPAPDPAPVPAPVPKHVTPPPVRHVVVPAPVVHVATPPPPAPVVVHTFRPPPAAHPRSRARVKARVAARKHHRVKAKHAAPHPRVYAATQPLRPRRLLPRVLILTPASAASRAPAPVAGGSSPIAAALGSVWRSALLGTLLVTGLLLLVLSVLQAALPRGALLVPGRFQFGLAGAALAGCAASLWLAGAL